MKRRLMAFTLPLAALIAGCDQTAAGPQMSMAATLTGAEIAVNVINGYQEAAGGGKGEYLFSKVDNYIVTQPRLDVEVRPASLGFTAEKVSVKYSDASGNPFADTSSTFNNAVAFSVPRGYTCPATGPCTFDPANAATQSFQKAELYVLSDAAIVTAAAQCVDGTSAVLGGYVCPEVRMNATFSGTTSTNAPATLKVSPAQVYVHIANVTDEVRK